jgi:hypothetical protein
MRAPGRLPRRPGSGRARGRGGAARRPSSTSLAFGFSLEEPLSKKTSPASARLGFCGSSSFSQPPPAISRSSRPEGGSGSAGVATAAAGCGASAVAAGVEPSGAAAARSKASWSWLAWRWAGVSKPVGRSGTVARLGNGRSAPGTSETPESTKVQPAAPSASAAAKPATPSLEARLGVTFCIGGPL